jgi:hypothetical protein
VDTALSALVALALGLALGRTPLGRRGHNLLARVVERGVTGVLRWRLARSSAGCVVTCLGFAGAAGLGSSVILWVVFMAAAASALNVALASALVIAIASGSPSLWPLRDARGHPAQPAFRHWLTLLWFYGLIGPAGALAAEVLLLAGSAGAQQAVTTGARALLAVVTYVPHRIADMVAAGLAPDQPPPAQPWSRQAAAVAWGVALAAGLATAFHFSGRHPDAYFRNWEGLAYLQRVAELSRSWEHGVIYPRIYPTFAWGYGYPLPNFYPPAVFFAGAALHQAGLGVAQAMNAVLWLILFVAALGAFLLANALAGPIFATLAAVFASAASAGVPTIIYVSGGAAQALGLAWIPFVLLALRRCYGRPGLGAALLLGLALAAEALIHNISMALVMALIALYVALRGVRHPGTRWVAGGAAMGLGLAAFFWLPAFAEKNCILSERLYQYWVLPWWSLVHLAPWWTALRGANLIGVQDQVPFIGRSLYLLRTKPPLIVWALGVMLLTGGYQGASEERRPVRDELFLWTALIALSYFTMAESAWAWGKGSLLRLLQGPSRMVPLVGVIGPALAAVAVRELWARLRSGRWFEVRLAIAWFAVYIAGAMLLFSSQTPWLRWSAWLRMAPPLALALVTLAAGRAARPRAAAATLVALVAVFAGVSARDRWHGLARRYHPIAAPASVFTVSGYRRWERDTTTQIVGSNVGEYLPRWTRGRRPTGCAPHQLAGAGCEIIAQRPGWLDDAFTVRVRRPAQCRYGALFYPGWQALCDGRAVTCRPSREGLVSFTVPPDTTTVEVRFRETRLRKAANVLSLVSLCVLAAMTVVVAARAHPTKDARYSSAA